MSHSRGQDPFESEEHMTAADYIDRGYPEEEAEDCPENLWADEEEETLLDVEVIQERDCAACRIQYELWEKIIEECGSAEYGRTAYEIFSAEAAIELNPNLVHSYSAWTMELVRYVRAEKNKYQLQQELQASKKPSGDD